jgi:diguanylate cyclase (GGDEF)-like protein
LKLSLPSASVRYVLFAWLVEPRGNPPAEVRAKLLGQLLSSPAAVMMGATTGVVISGIALYLDRSWVFVLFASLEIFCALVRLLVLRGVAKKAAAEQLPAIDLSVTMAILWCSLQGAMSFVAMRTNMPTIQIFSATMIMAIIGPIYARNYTAPRLAFFLVLLCNIPFLAGCCASGRALLWIMVPLAPPFLFGSWQIIVNLQRMSLMSLTAELVNREWAHLDALTGLGNRRAFDQALATMSQGNAGAFALLCLDLDGFKAVNDTWGHLAGDALLIGVSDRLMASVRAEDSAFRLGGDEFVVVVRDLSSDQVAAFAERLIQDISFHAYVLAGVPPIRIGVSLGFACYPDDGTDLPELHRRADLALYESKSAGKGVQRRFRLRVVSG